MYYKSCPSKMGVTGRGRRVAKTFSLEIVASTQFGAKSDNSLLSFEVKLLRFNHILVQWDFVSGRRWGRWRLDIAQ